MMLDASPSRSHWSALVVWCLVGLLSPICFRCGVLQDTRQNNNATDYKIGLDKRVDSTYRKVIAI